LLKAAGRVGLQIDRVYFCPHTHVDSCQCRKPEIGMLKRAEVELNIDLSKSYMIGDMTGDIVAGQAAGCKTILVRTGKAGQDGLYQAQADFIVDNLNAAVEIIQPVEPGKSQVI
jgi:histidinol phosphatase-like enzyme